MLVQYKSTAIIGEISILTHSLTHRVFYRRHEQIKNIIKMIVLQMLFDSEHLETYITRKIHQFSSNVHIAENISQALQTPEAEGIIDRRLDHLYSRPEVYYLQALGLTREKLKPMIRPAVISLCAESAPYVLDTINKPNVEQVSEWSVEIDRERGGGEGGRERERGGWEGCRTNTLVPIQFLIKPFLIVS